MIIVEENGVSSDGSERGEGEKILYVVECREGVKKVERQGESE